MALVGMHSRLIVYSYLDISDVLCKASLVSKRDRRELDNSGIAMKGKNWDCSMFERDFHVEGDHPYSIERLHETASKAQYLFRYIEQISVSIDTK